MRGKFIALSIVGVVFVVGLSLVLFRSRSSEFGLTSSTPSNKAKDFDPDKQLSYEFSSFVDPLSPYDSFSITPKVDGKVEVRDGSLVFTPTTGFDEQTEYGVTITNVRSVEGKTYTVKGVSFTTAKRRVSSFESQLPYDGGDYTIDRLSDGRINITIISSPIDATKQIALKFLADKGIDTKKVTFTIAASARE